MSAAPTFASSGAASEAAERFTARRWEDIEAAMPDAFDGDRVVVVTESGARVVERSRALRWLSDEFPDAPWSKLRAPAPSGAVLLVLLREDEVGVALARPMTRHAGSA